MRRSCWADSASKKTKTLAQHSASSYVVDSTSGVGKKRPGHPVIILAAGAGEGGGVLALHFAGPPGRVAGLIEGRMDVQVHETLALTPAVLEALSKSHANIRASSPLADLVSEAQTKGPRVSNAFLLSWYHVPMIQSKAFTRSGFFAALRIDTSNERHCHHAQAQPNDVRYSWPRHWSRIEG